MAANKKKADAMEEYQKALDAHIAAKTKLADALGVYEKDIEELSKQLKDGQRLFENLWLGKGQRLVDPDTD